MSALSAKVVADSVSPTGARITTLQLCYPRFIHAELMTHRVFSRNASSSRAIPVEKMIEQARKDPVVPWHWGKNQRGMQAGAELGPESREAAEFTWRDAAYLAAGAAESLSDLGLHKQIANRLLEPFQWMHTIVTATEWDNFFALRDHWMAEPHFRDLAVAIKDARQQSTPFFLKEGMWHLPYVSVDEIHSYAATTCLKLSTARCARVSYMNHDGTEPVIERDMQLHDQLVIRTGGNTDPIHASPAEHQACPDATIYGSWDNVPFLRGNFRGWMQYRKFIEAGFCPVRSQGWAR